MLAIPVTVIDWVTGTVEDLSQESPALTTDVQISDDQRLVATTTNDGGWYEYAAAPTSDAPRRNSAGPWR
jgi:hypothetical protein